jgi:hypothetical protein
VVLSFGKSLTFACGQLKVPKGDIQPSVIALKQTIACFVKTIGDPLQCSRVRLNRPVHQVSWIGSGFEVRLLEALGKRLGY